jgi:hypothetical protein
LSTVTPTGKARSITRPPPALAQLCLKGGDVSAPEGFGVLVARRIGAGEPVGEGYSSHLHPGGYQVAGNLDAIVGPRRITEHYATLVDPGGPQAFAHFISQAR